MKTKEELNALKEEVETLNEKLQELSEEELAQVSGGGPIIGENPKYKIGDWVFIGGFSYGKEWETGTRVTNIIPEGLVQYELTTYEYDKDNKTVSVTATDILPEYFIIRPSITPYWANVVTD